MATIADLTYTDNLASNKKPILTDWRESLDSIQTYINDKVKDNLLQLTADAYPSAYAFDDDGVAQYTNNLYDKLTQSATYSGGDVTLSTTGSWVDIDLANVKIDFTPELAGDFRATFQFNVESVTSNATNETDIRFRITDGSDVSDATPRIKLITGVSGTTNTSPVVVTHVFDSLAAAAQTIKAQYFLSTSTATTIKCLANSNDIVSMHVEKV